MTGLMVMFLLIAVTFMMRVEADAYRVRQVAVAYSEIKDALFEDLQAEFKNDLPRWKAQIIKEDLSIRFTEPEVLFAPGSSELKPEFRAILSDFFPRYVRILTSPKYKGSINLIRLDQCYDTRRCVFSQYGTFPSAYAICSRVFLGS
jgi:hypothetical protein